MRRFLSILLVVVVLFKIDLYAQQNRSFAEHIRTVETVVNGDRTAPAVINLRSSDRVEISFDDMTHDYVRYVYKLEHCDKDWKTTGSLFESDYMTGTNLETPIEDYTQSMNTSVLYTHYVIGFPNSYVRPLISGNYRVSIFDEEDTESPLAEAFFSVCENRIGVGAKATTNTDIDYNDSHQQLDISLNFRNMRVQNPEKEICVKVLQNRRYDNAVTPKEVTFQDAQGMKWEHCRDLIFDAGNEYKKFEILDLHQPTMGVDIIRWYEPYYHALLYTDKPRKNYIHSEEQNGSYVIRNEHNINSEAESEYVIVHYSLEMPKLKGGNLYVAGQWTGYHFIPEYKMEYDVREHKYTADILMKQGYYNYMYLFVPNGCEEGSVKEVEGSFYQTENEYTILVYARSHGERYDKLLGYRTFRFIPNK